MECKQIRCAHARKIETHYNKVAKKETREKKRRREKVACFSAGCASLPLFLTRDAVYPVISSSNFVLSKQRINLLKIARVTCVLSLSRSKRISILARVCIRVGIATTSRRCYDDKKGRVCGLWPTSAVSAGQPRFPVVTTVSNDEKEHRFG